MDTRKVVVLVVYVAVSLVTYFFFAPPFDYFVELLATAAAIGVVSQPNYHVMTEEEIKEEIVEEKVAPLRRSGTQTQDRLTTRHTSEEDEK